MTKEERRIYNREYRDRIRIAENSEEIVYKQKQAHRNRASESGISMACFAGSRKWIEEKFSQVPDYVEPEKKRKKTVEICFEPEAEKQTYVASQCENLRKYGRL